MLISDDFGLRSPVIQKKNQAKSSTSIVARVIMGAPSNMECRHRKMFLICETLFAVHQPFSISAGIAEGKPISGINTR